VERYRQTRCHALPAAIAELDNKFSKSCRAAPRTEWLRAWAVEHEVAPDDLDAFTTRALAQTLALHPGNLHRYGLRVSDYDAWKALYPPAA
jgi:hypothetical protein